MKGTLEIEMKNQNKRKENGSGALLSEAEKVDEVEERKEKDEKEEEVERKQSEKRFSCNLCGRKVP